MSLKGQCHTSQQSQRNHWKTLYICSRKDWRATNVSIAASALIPLAAATLVAASCVVLCGFKVCLFLAAQLPDLESFHLPMFQSALLPASVVLRWLSNGEGEATQRGKGAREKQRLAHVHTWGQFEGLPISLMCFSRCCGRKLKNSGRQSGEHATFSQKDLGIEPATCSRNIMGLNQQQNPPKTVLCLSQIINIPFVCVCDSWVMLLPLIGSTVIDPNVANGSGLHQSLACTHYPER